jgi:glycerol-1-phosphate dehydrogenase [NAD(P)+]
MAGGRSTASDLDSSHLNGLSDPTDLPALRAALAAEDPEGRLVPLGLDRVAVGAEVVGTVADAVVEQLTRAGRPGTGPVVVLVDATPIFRAGEDLKALVEAQLTSRFAGERTVRRVVLRGHHPTLHVDDDALDAATKAVADAAAVVSVGGGTITDIAKVATARHRDGATADAGGIPLVVVQTAASVDGYTDNVSVVLRDGVKRTIPSRWPDVVVADVTTISTAPRELNTAGYGEVLSMLTAPADWYLASVLGLDSTFHRAPRDLLAVFGRGLDTWSPGVAKGDLGAIGQLTRMLAVRGVATGVAGTTACLSGVEHLVSHMLDMHNGAHGQPIGLHGAQVGVASVVAAAAWEHLFAVLDPKTPTLLFPDAEAVAARRPAVLAAFADLDPTGKVGEECWRDYSAKLTRWSAGRDTVLAAFAEWDGHRAAVDELLVDSGTLAAGLVAAGAVARFSDLDPAVDAKTARWAVAHCHLMRNRFTVIDLLDLLGRWTPADQDTVTAAAAAAIDRAVGA